MPAVAEADDVGHVTLGWSEIMGGYNTPDTVVNLNPKYSDINYMSRFFLLMCNPESCPAFSRPRNFGRRLLKFCPSFSSPAFSRPSNICLSFSSLSFSRPLVFFVRHFQVVHFQRPFYFTCNQLQWLHMKQSTEIILKIFQNNFIARVTTT